SLVPYTTLFRSVAAPLRLLGLVRQEDEVPEALGGAREDREVLVGLGLRGPARGAIVAVARIGVDRVGGDVDLLRALAGAADDHVRLDAGDRLDAGGLARGPQSPRRCDRPVVRDRDSGVAVGGGRLRDALHGRQAVELRVLGVGVEVDELALGHSGLRSVVEGSWHDSQWAAAEGHGAERPKGRRLTRVPACTRACARNGQRAAAYRACPRALCARPRVRAREGRPKGRRLTRTRAHYARTRACA